MLTWKPFAQHLNLCSASGLEDLPHYVCSAFFMFKRWSKFLAPILPKLDLCLVAEKIIFLLPNIDLQVTHMVSQYALAATKMWATAVFNAQLNVTWFACLLSLFLLGAGFRKFSSFFLIHFFLSCLYFPSTLAFTVCSGLSKILPVFITAHRPFRSRGKRLI